MAISYTRKTDIFFMFILFFMYYEILALENREPVNCGLNLKP